MRKDFLVKTGSDLMMMSMSQQAKKGTGRVIIKPREKLGKFKYVRDEVKKVSKDLEIPMSD